MSAKIDLKDARPKLGFKCHFWKGQKRIVQIIPIKVSDWAWLDVVDIEGYDNALGPCYWRATPLAFYSTILHLGKIYLIIFTEWSGKFENCALPEMAVRKYLNCPQSASATPPSVSELVELKRKAK